MKFLARTVLVLALLAPTVADAKCFLFFCPPPRHHVARHHVAQHGHERGVSRTGCDGIAAAWAGTDKSKNDFVLAFPAAQQKRVLLCLEKINE